MPGVWSAEGPVHSFFFIILYMEYSKDLLISLLKQANEAVQKKGFFDLKESVIIAGAIETVENEKATDDEFAKAVNILHQGVLKGMSPSPFQLQDCVNLTFVLNKYYDSVKQE